MLNAELSGYYHDEARYPAAMVNVTNHCNLSCRHCFIFRDGNPNQAPLSIRDEMSDDVMLMTLEKLRDRHGIKSMMWMGGEPMLRHKLLKKGIQLFESNTITTNGTIPLIDFGPDLLYVISLDGPEDLNDSIRGEGVFRKVMKNLEALPVDFQSPFQVQCVVTRSNQSRLEELVLRLVDSSVRWMTFTFLVPAADGETNPDAWHNNKEREEAVRIVMALKEKYPGFVRNSTRSLELMFSPYAERVTAACPSRANILPLYLEGDHFTTPYCCYGNDVDCERCGAWAVFQIAAKMERNGAVSW
ncbi:MAG: radical SAM protein [Gammaproteobacteria bacterium]|nr:radical SAM protein [Gammaproteobacteria bacterium]